MTAVANTEPFAVLKFNQLATAWNLSSFFAAALLCCRPFPRWRAIDIVCITLKHRAPVRGGTSLTECQTETRRGCSAGTFTGTAAAAAAAAIWSIDRRHKCSAISISLAVLGGALAAPPPPAAGGATRVSRPSPGQRRKRRAAADGAIWAY